MMLYLRIQQASSLKDTSTKHIKQYSVGGSSIQSGQLSNLASEIEKTVIIFLELIYNNFFSNLKHHRLYQKNILLL